MSGNETVNDGFFKLKKSCPKKEFVKLLDFNAFIKNVKV